MSVKVVLHYDQSECKTNELGKVVEERSRKGLVRDVTSLAIFSGYPHKGNHFVLPEVQKNLQALLDNVLNPIASKYPVPYNINSGYRCPALNAAVGGVKNSQHMKGQAADISCGSPAANKKLFDWIINQSGINYDQIIDEKGYRWIHISFNPSGCRKKVTHL